MKVSLRAKLALSFALALLVFAILGVASYRSTSRVVEGAAWIAHTNRVLEDIETIRADLGRAETYSLSAAPAGARHIRQDYRAVTAEIRKTDRHLRMLTREDPAQLRSLDRLDGLLGRWMSLQNRLVEGSVGAAEQTALRDRQAGLARQIGGALKEMQHHEQATLESRAEKSLPGVRQTRLFSLVTVALACFLVLGSFFVIDRDVQERERAERTVRREKEFSQALIRSSMDGIVAYDRDFNLTLWNPGMESLTGIPRDEILGRRAFDVSPFLVEAGLEQTMAAPLKGRNAIAGDQPYTIAQTGKSGFFEATYSPLRGASGEIIGGLGIVRDITERKRAEGKFRDLLEAAPDAMVIADQENRIVLANAQAERLFGYAKKELIGRPVEMLLPESARDSHARHAATYFALPHSRRMGTGLELVGRRKDGTIFPAEISLGPLETEEGPLVSSAIRDISDRKATQRELEARTRQQEAIAQLGQRALSGLDLAPLFDEAVALVAQTLDVELCKVLELLPDGRQLLLRAGVGWKEGAVGRALVDAGTESQAGYTLASREPVVVEDLRAETRFSGPELLVDHGVVSGVSVIIMGRERPFGILGAHTRERREFTSDHANFLQSIGNVLAAAIQRRRTEEAIRESEERFRQMAENVEEVFWMFDSTGTKGLYVNPAYEAIWGRSCESLRREPLSWQDAIHPNDRSRVAGIYDHIVNRGSFAAEFRIIRPDGSVRWIWDRGFPIRDETGRVHRIVGIAMDITTRKQAEESLRRLSAQLLRAQDSERRRIARELHDTLGQRLAALAMNLSWLGSSPVSADPKARTILNESRDLVDQSVQETRTLSYLLHPPLLEELGLSSTVTWYVQGFIERSGIQVELDIPENLGRLPRALELALFRVVQEGLTNVQRHSGSASASVRFAREDSSIVVEVADRGRGMPQLSVGDSPRRSRLGVGIAGMQERLRELGGMLDIRSDQSGTRLRASIPMRRES
jgi:PAS domain S-box-containing protein